MDQDYMAFDPQDQEISDSLQGLQDSLDANADGTVDVMLDYEDEGMDYVPEKPAPKPKKKKSAKKRYSQMAMGAMIVAAILLILLLVFMRLNRVRTGREDALAEAYNKYTAGDETAVEEIRTLSEKYEPARIVLALVEAGEQAANTADTQDTGFGSDVVTAPAAASNANTANTGDPAIDEASTMEDAFAADVDDEEEEEEAAEPQSDEVQAAVKLWKDGDYSEAMTAFNELSTAGKLSYSTSGAKSGDAVLSYGAVCAMLDLYNKVGSGINYEDVVIYDCEGMESGDYDLTKPVYIFESSSSTYLCAFSKADKKYVYWTKDSDQIEAAEKGKKHDLLSMTSMLSIRKQVQ